jgi:hypothetical protein
MLSEHIISNERGVISSFYFLLIVYFLLIDSGCESYNGPSNANGASTNGLVSSVNFAAGHFYY